MQLLIYTLIAMSIISPTNVIGFQLFCIGCFIKKQQKYVNYPYEYKLNMSELHEVYKNILKPKNQSITRKYVIDYINSLPPAKLMFAINYNKRTKR